MLEHLRAMGQIMKSCSFIIFVATQLICWSCIQTRPQDDDSVVDEAWNKHNDPSRFGKIHYPKWDSAPLSFNLLEEPDSPDAVKPWSSWGWSTYKGSVANRWQIFKSGTHYRHFLYQFPTPEEIKKMSSTELNALSPAEKYDLLDGRLDLPFARLVRDRVLSEIAANGDVPHWHGICHGWSMVSIREQQPGPQATRELPVLGGKKIVFYSSDIQALLSQFYAGAASMGVLASFAGERCESKTVIASGGRIVTRTPEGRRISLDACNDTNAGSFHLLVTKFLAGEKQSIIMERDLAAPVWNKPIYKYEMKRGKPRKPYANDHAIGTEAVVDINMTILTANGADPRHNPTPLNTKTDYYNYDLEINADGDIIGGKWKKQNRPDYLWMLEAAPDSGLTHPHLDFIKLKKLNQDSQSGARITRTPSLPKWRRLQGDDGKNAGDWKNNVQLKRFVFGKSGDQLNLMISALVHKIPIGFTYVISAEFEDGRTQILYRKTRIKDFVSKRIDNLVGFHPHWKSFESQPTKITLKIIDVQEVHYDVTVEFEDGRTETKEFKPRIENQSEGTVKPQKGFLSPWIHLSNMPSIKNVRLRKITSGRTRLERSVSR